MTSRGKLSTKTLNNDGEIWIKPIRSKFKRYSIALLLTLLALVFKFILIRTINWPEGSLLLSTASIMIVAWYGGFRPGVLATFLNYLIADYLFIGAKHSFLIHNSIADNLRLLIFISQGVFISWLFESLHRARMRVESYTLMVAQSEQFFRSLVNNVKDYAIFMVNPKGRIISWNDGARAIFGYDSADIITKPFSALFLPEAIKRRTYNNLLKNALSRTRQENEGWNQRKDGSYFWASIMLTALNKKSEPFIGYSVIVRDLTQRKRLEDLKDEFLAIAAHELKTPITTSKLIIENWIKEFKQNKDLRNKVKDVQDMNSELDRLSLLVNDILDVSRVGTKKFTMEMETIEITYLVESVVRKMRKVTGNKNIKFEKSPKIELLADPKRIEQVIINLINNAARYSQNSGNIKVSTEKLNKHVLISIQDQGRGIPKDQLRFVFDKYYQVDNNSERGFGLGLYISKRIIQLHKGRIWVDSKEEVGSTFYFSLPRLSS